MVLNRKDFLLSTIAEIGKFQMQYFGRDVKTETKMGDLDFVTFADTEGQKMFTEKLKANFPEDVVMGEENYDKDQDYSKEKNLWIIDPVDGTLLFKKGIPLFGIMIAYVENGEIKLSAIFLPALNELYHADEAGAYKNGERISVSDTTDFKKSVTQISTFSLLNFLPDAVHFQDFFRDVGMNIDTYAMAYGATACASGKIDGGGFYPNYGNIWDCVPTGFLVQQAGGRVTTVGQDTWDIWNRNIIYSNGNIHEDLQRALRG